MKPSLSSAIGTVLSIFLIPLTSASDATFMGLGDLPGGKFQSDATAVSADGTVVVGRSASAAGDEGFRWTPGEGMRGLGDLPGGGFSSCASGVSADGQVVAGFLLQSKMASPRGGHLIPQIRAASQLTYLL